MREEPITLHPASLDRERAGTPAAHTGSGLSPSKDDCCQHLRQTRSFILASARSSGNCLARDSVSWCAGWSLGCRLLDYLENRSGKDWHHMSGRHKPVCGDTAEIKGDYHWIKSATKWYVNRHLCLSFPKAVYIRLETRANIWCFHTQSCFPKKNLECNVIRSQQASDTLLIARGIEPVRANIVVHCYSEVCLGKSSRKMKITAGVLQLEPRGGRI